MVSEPKKRVSGIGSIEPMGNDPKVFPEADYLANTEKKSRRVRTWILTIGAIVLLTILGIVAIYSFATRLDYQRHH